MIAKGVCMRLLLIQHPSKRTHGYLCQVGVEIARNVFLLNCNRKEAQEIFHHIINQQNAPEFQVRLCQPSNDVNGFDVMDYNWWVNTVDGVITG